VSDCTRQMQDLESDDTELQRLDPSLRLAAHDHRDRGVQLFFVLHLLTISVVSAGSVTDPIYLSVVNPETILISVVNPETIHISVPSPDTIRVSVISLDTVLVFPV
jgi:hypothetical protein